MPPDVRSTGSLRPAAATDTAPRALVSLLAGAGRPADVLPHLHLHAVERVGGRCAILFRHNPRNGVLQATSGFSLDALRTDPWQPLGDEAAIVQNAFKDGAPVLVSEADRRMPDLAGRLGTASALLFPLARDADRVGLLAVGFEHAPMSLPDDVAE